MFAKLFAPTVEVSAHCDLPCGVYDPAQARIEAESIKGIIAKVADNDDPDFRTRAIIIKEQRAELVKAGAESLLETNKDGDIYDPDAELQRDIRGLERHICAGITEGAIQGADVVIKSGAGMVDANLTAIASATQFVADSIRDDLERGKASMDLLTLGLTQIPPLLEVLEKVENGGDAIQPAWRSLAETTREDIKETLRALHGGAQSRVRMLKEKYDWHDDVLHLEQGLEQAWEILK